MTSCINVDYRVWHIGQQSQPKDKAGDVRPEGVHQQDSVPRQIKIGHIPGHSSQCGGYHKESHEPFASLLPSFNEPIVRSVVNKRNPARITRMPTPNSSPSTVEPAAKTAWPRVSPV